MTRAELAAAGLDLPAETHARLRHFVERLLDENQRINLTATRDASAYWAAHVCDCLALTKGLVSLQARSLVDVGSGGGLPGAIVACVRTDLEVTLLDATRKKLSALERICADVGLRNVSTLWGRAEQLSHRPEWRERFDVASARAVAAPPIVCELTSGLVRPGGFVFLFASLQGADESRAEVARAIRKLSLSARPEQRYRLPGKHGERVLLSFEKAGRLDPRLPREGSQISSGAIG